VCSYLCSKELLVTLALTAKTVRDRLTPACFAAAELDLDKRELAILSSLPPPTASSAAFHRRLLSHCSLRVLRTNDIAMRQVLDSLDHFPSCRSLTLSANGRWQQQLADSELHDLLRHPTTRTCQQLTVAGYHHGSTEWVSVVDDDDAQVDVQAARARRRQRNSLVRFFTRRSSRKQPFDWADIRLPAVTRLTLVLYGLPLYVGGTAFVTAHTALQRLDVSTTVVSVAELTAIFRDEHALPSLTHFGLCDSFVYEGSDSDLPLLLTALATTVVAASGSVRPMSWLKVGHLAPRSVLAAAALMPGLTHVKLHNMPGWLEEWSASEERLGAFPQLQGLIMYEFGEHLTREQELRAPAPADRSMLPLLRAMAARPLRILDIRTHGHVTCSAAAMAQLAQLRQLHTLHWDAYRASNAEDRRMDWTDPTLFASFTAGCLPCLRSVQLRNMRLSAPSVAAIASAAPQLRDFEASNIGLTCHPAVVCAIVGGQCEHIEQLRVGDPHLHVLDDVLTDVTLASTVIAAGRTGRWRPFTRLRSLRVSMCWCTPPSVWHALLSLLQHAVQLRCVACLAIDDPLAVASLSLLPCLAILSANCLWPLPFAQMMERRLTRTGRYRYLACHAVRGATESGYYFRTELGLSDRLEAAWNGRHPVTLRPRSRLFAAYQRSLNVEQQAVMARWAAGDYRAEDETFHVHCGEERQAAPAGQRGCPHPLALYTRWQSARSEAADVREAEISVVEAAENELHEEEEQRTGYSRGCVVM